MRDAARAGATRPVPLVSLGLAILGLTLLVVGLPLVVAPGATDRYFAWTIDAPATAAFLGACYWTAAVFSFLSARARTWACARVVMPGILVAGTLILLATLIHLDRFAMDTARGWIWLVLYSGLLPGTLLMLLIQRRAGRVDPPVLRPLERWATAALACAGTALLAFGAALFALPDDAAAGWPWPLTDLTARMTGAWLAALGATLIAARRAGDWSRLGPTMTYAALVAAWHVATLIRYWDSVDRREAAWFHIVFCLGLFALAIRDLSGRRQAAPGRPDPQPGRP